MLRLNLFPYKLLVAKLNHLSCNLRLAAFRVKKSAELRAPEIDSWFLFLI